MNWIEQILTRKLSLVGMHNYLKNTMQAFVQFLLVIFQVVALLTTNVLLLLALPTQTVLDSN